MDIFCIPHKPNKITKLKFGVPFQNLNIKHPVPPLPAVAAVREKKSNNSYSAAGDDDINDVAAMGGVNLQEEANVSFICSLYTYSCVNHKAMYFQ